MNDAQRIRVFAEQRGKKCRTWMVGKLLDQMIPTLSTSLERGARGPRVLTTMTDEGAAARLYQSTGLLRRLVGLALRLLFLLGAISPSSAQRGPPEVTVATPILKRIMQWDEYTGQFEAMRRVEIRARVSGEFTDGPRGHRRSLRRDPRAGRRLLAVGGQRHGRGGRVGEALPESDARPERDRDPAGLRHGRLRRRPDAGGRRVAQPEPRQRGQPLRLRRSPRLSVAARSHQSSSISAS